MALQQKVPERAHGQREPKAKESLPGRPCFFSAMFPVLEWADGCFLIPPKKKLMVGYYLRISLKLSLAGGYLQGEAAIINTPMPPSGSAYVSILLGFLDASQMRSNSWGSSNINLSP